MSLPGATGFRLDGPAESSSGYSVAGAGDVNGDGFDDLIVGAPNGGHIGLYGTAGKSFVVFGTTKTFATSLDLAALDGSNGFRLERIGESDDRAYSGWSVAGAGDVNGDGFNDLIIGAFGADLDDKPGAGESYVVFGTNTGFAASIGLAALDGTNGFRLAGVDAGDFNGWSVAGAGDVNGDGIDDLIVGAPGAGLDDRSNAGESYVVFGADIGFAASLDLAALDGSNGIRLEGTNTNDVSGSTVARAGDINGDGIADLIIGAPGTDPDGQYGGKYNAGESYVVFGTDSGFAASLDFSTLDGSNGFRLEGIDEGDFSGHSVAEAGDVNGDGIDDLIVGASTAGSAGKPYAGESYVVFGINTGFEAILDLAALDGSNGFRLDGFAYDLSGASVAGAGDINGDGIDDLIIGAPGFTVYNAYGPGGSYVVFGRDTGFGASLDLAALDGLNGFRFEGIDWGDFSGSSVAGAGDINGDGFDDMIIGAPGAKGGAGESYVVFGGADRLAGLDRLSGRDGVIALADVGTRVGTDAREVLSGTAGNDILCSFGGADTLRGQLGADVLRGGTGWDSLDGGGNWDELFGGWGNDQIEGKLGRDLLQGQRGSDKLLGGGGDDTLVGGLGADVLAGGAGNDVFVFRGDFESSGSERDTLTGDTGLPAFEVPGMGTGDLIDLNRIDADATVADDQAFIWSGLTPGGRGTLWLSRSGSLTLVNGNLDDDATIEFQLAIDDARVPASAYRVQDFIL